MNQIPVAVFSLISSSLLSVAEVITSSSAPFAVLKNSTKLLIVSYRTQTNHYFRFIFIFIIIFFKHAINSPPGLSAPL